MRLEETLCIIANDMPIEECLVDFYENPVERQNARILHRIHSFATFCKIQHIVQANVADGHGITFVTRTQSSLKDETQKSWRSLHNDEDCSRAEDRRGRSAL